jgi:NAD(P)H-dependent FMN reductase
LSEEGKLYIPVLLGTSRMGRFSEPVAKFMTEETAKRHVVETKLIDIGKIPLAAEGEGEEIKDPKFSAEMARADGLILVVPEYNHGYPGSLKRVLDTNLKEYVHKAVGICGVSAGPFGGARVIQNLIPVTRELGLVNIFWDVNFASVQDVFNENGELCQPAFLKRAEKFLNELIWMARVLRHGRRNVPVRQGAS